MNLYRFSALSTYKKVDQKFEIASILNMPSRVYIGRLNRRATERDIEKFFKNYGRIADVMLKNGFGFVVGFSYIENYNLTVELIERSILVKYFA